MSIPGQGRYQMEMCSHPTKAHHSVLSASSQLPDPYRPKWHRPDRTPERQADLMRRSCARYGREQGLHVQPPRHHLFSLCSHYPSGGHPPSLPKPHTPAPRHYPNHSLNSAARILVVISASLTVPTIFRRLANRKLQDCFRHSSRSSISRFVDHMTRRTIP